MKDHVLNRGPSEYIAEALKLDVTYNISLEVLLKCEHGNVPHKHSITYDLLITVDQMHIDTLKTEEGKVAKYRDRYEILDETH
jgi:hypothetical protein